MIPSNVPIEALLLENLADSAPSLVGVFIVGVVALCFLAIMSFVFVIFQINNTFYGINTMHKINLVIEEYAMYKNLGKTETEIETFLEDEINNYGGNYIYLEEKGASLGDVNKIVFSVKYYLP